MVEEDLPPVSDATRKRIIREWKSAQQRARRARVKAREEVDTTPPLEHYGDFHEAG
jgi:hypothetical protein